MPNLKPLRAIDEYDTINVFACNTVPANKGTFVKVLSGWENNEDDINLMLGSVGAVYGNTVSERYGVQPRVVAATSGDTPIGMLLYDVREVDENGEQLKFNPRKAIEMQVALSGQAVPIMKRGIVLYSGIAGNPTGGAAAYFSDTTAGELMTTPANSGYSAGGYTPVTVGRFLGQKDADGYAFVWVDL